MTPRGVGVRDRRTEVWEGEISVLRYKYRYRFSLSTYHEHYYTRISNVNVSIIAKIRNNQVHNKGRVEYVRGCGTE